MKNFEYEILHDGVLHMYGISLIYVLKGGVIARALFTLKGFNAKLVHTIITQATPHQSPGN